MLAIHINRPKVKLSLERVANGVFDIYRDGAKVGRVRKFRPASADLPKGEVPYYAPPRASAWQYSRDARLRYFDWTPAPSFRVAALALVRGDRVEAEHVYPYKPCLVSRVQVDCVWYTVITPLRDGCPSSRGQHIFPDHTPAWENPDPATSVRIRRALEAALCEAKKVGP